MSPERRQRAEQRAERRRASQTAGQASRQAGRQTSKGDAAEDKGLVRRAGDWLRGAVFDNAPLKFVSMVLAITLFILVNTNKEAIIGVNMGISYQFPEDRVLVSERVDEVRLTIKGPWRRIKHFDERELERLNVDLTNMSSGPYTFSEDAIHLPDGLTLLSINPATIPIAFEQRVEKTVPVTVLTSGEPARGFKMARLSPRPSQVTIRGAESAVRAVDSVSTRELSIEGRTDSFIEALQLETPRTTPPGLVEIVDHGPVQVDIELVPEMSTRTVSKVPVQVVAGPGFNASNKTRFTTEPATVDVVLHGPLLVVESFQDTLTAYVTVHSEDGSGRPREASVHLANVPEGVGIEVKPSTVLLRGTKN